MDQSLNLIAVGRGEGLYSSIEHLSAKGFKISLIITDKEYKEYVTTSADYELLARRIGADFLALHNIDAEVLRPYVGNGGNAKVAISANWRFRISGDVIDLFELGILNCHMGQLPDYKGNAAANWMISRGERFMYVDIHKMDDGLDTGDIISRKKFDISDDTYLADLWNACNESMPELFEEALVQLSRDASYKLAANSPTGMRGFPRLEADHQIDWQMPALDVSRLVHASSRPLTGAFTFVDGDKVIIWKARQISLPYPFLAVPGHLIQINRAEGTVLVACKSDVLEVEEIEVAGETMPPTKYFKSIRKRCVHRPYP